MGLLEGSDPKLKDHLGITPPVGGDSINNGALDNAAGVATTLEVARLFRIHGKAPKRSLLFLIDTADEKGLIGAEYFAHNPTVPAKSIVADVDLDMPILTYEFTDVVAFGADRSSIEPSVKKAAARMNVTLSPDPMPDEGIFARSDHYRFVEQGVPGRLHGTSLSQTERRHDPGAALRHWCQIRPSQLVRSSPSGTRWGAWISRGGPPCRRFSS